ncbi:MAG: hypothetical protein WBM11_18735 [Terriglobales bacterium]
MTSTELERKIREKLEAVGLSQALDEHRSQFLEFPDGFFVELTLNDGSKLVEVERITRELRELLAKEDVEVDVIVRANWAVQSIEGPTPAISVSGGIRAAWAFQVVLASGSLITRVEVDVTQLAVQEIKQKVKEGSLRPADETAAMKEVVKEFVKLQLSFGGESHWDPIRYPQQELNESALLYLFGHSVVGKR